MFSTTYRMKRPKVLTYINAGRWILWLSSCSMDENFGS